MKKFLIFLVATIVTVCIGMTFYQFAKNDEVIKVNTETIYINYGDKLSLDDLGFSRIDASKNTKIDFNAGGDEVTSIIKFDETSNCYIPTSKGGATTIKISTSNRKYKSFSIDVVVGTGSEENPYYISSEAQLSNIGKSYDLSSCFKLVKDIEMTNPHTPIGLIDGRYNEFTGKFDGNFHTISNLKIDNCDYAGLFAIMSANSSVYNLNIDKANIQGSYINAGSVAGICYGTINKVVVSNAVINNTKSSSNTGAVVGLLQTDVLNNITAGILRTSAYTDQNTVISANGVLGGIAGTVNSAVVHACYTNLSLSNSSTSTTGGLIGQLFVNRDTYVRESYSITKIQSNGSVGNIIGSISLSPNTKIADVNKSLVLVGLYYDNTLNSYSGVASDVNGFSTTTNFAINGKATAQMKTKNTYVYYVGSSNNIVYWDKVWYLVDGEYPTLTFISKFDDVIIEDSSQTPTNPDDNNPNNPANPDDSNPDITNPDAPSTDVVIIYNKQDLLTALQSATSINKNYILANDIDLGGISWTPVAFSGTFKSSDGNAYTISNFSINSSLAHVGFFSTLSSASISNVNFNNVDILTNGSNQTAGGLVGYICGNTTINNVGIYNTTITASTKYAGGMVGYAGNSIVNIYNGKLQNIIISNSVLNAGGVIGYTSENTYVHNCTLNGNTVISAIDRAGGIASVNYGKIVLCDFVGIIRNISSASVAGYFGGIVGVNYGRSSDTTANATISINNTSANSIYYFAGGLCGYNLGAFNSCVSNGSMTGNRSTSAVYLGGLTGYNAGELYYCWNSIDTIGEVRNNIYVAGLAVYNYGGTIFGCVSYSNLNGYQVAGLVRSNGNNGVVDSCLAGNSFYDRASYKGVEVAGFVYEMSSGRISNCLVSATLHGNNNDSWCAGIAGFMPYTSGKFGTISYSIANITFAGNGKAYLELAQDGLMKKNRTTGTITNCVISEDAKVKNIIISEYNKFLWVEKQPGSGSNFIIANDSELKNIETYLDVETCDFDISYGQGASKWKYVSNGRIPLPRAILVIFENAVG